MRRDWNTSSEFSSDERISPRTEVSDEEEQRRSGESDARVRDGRVPARRAQGAYGR